MCAFGVVLKCANTWTTWFKQANFILRPLLLFKSILSYIINILLNLYHVYKSVLQRFERHRSEIYQTLNRFFTCSSFDVLLIWYCTPCKIITCITISLLNPIYLLMPFEHYIRSLIYLFMYFSFICTFWVTFILTAFRQTNILTLLHVFCSVILLTF